MAGSVAKDAQLERLNNEEFREFIPHMQLDELLITQIKIKDKWTNMFTFSCKKQKTTFISCNMCHEPLKVFTLKDHLQSEKHKNAIKSVEQFCHPIYTYTRDSEKIAKGEKISDAEKQKAIAKANVELDSTVKIKLAQASIIDKQVNSLEFQETLIEVALNTDAAKPEQIFAEVSLPLPELLRVEFSIKLNEWKPMLTTINPTRNGKYVCVLCTKHCAGIITVNAHINGYTHKSLQLGTLGVRLRNNRAGGPILTKNCSYRFDEKYSFAIRKEGAEFFKDRVNQIISSKTTDTHADTTNTPCEVIDGIKIKIEDTSDELPAPDDANGEPDSKIDSQHDFPQKNLSAKVAAKAKVLAYNTSKDVSLNTNTNTNTPEIDDEGLIGVEYVVKLIKAENDPTPMYECCLCKIVLNEGRMQGHLIGYNHRLKYCELHYSDTIRTYKDTIGHIKYFDFFRVMGLILSKLALAIEKHHGRSVPYSISAPKFQKLRTHIIQQLSDCKHACQQHGPSFTKLVSVEEIARIIANSEPYKPHSVPSNHPGRFATTPKDKVYVGQGNHDLRVQLRDEKLDAAPTRAKSPKGRHEKYQPKEVVSRPRSRSPQRHASQRQRSKPLPEREMRAKDIWKVYREQVSIAASEVESSYVKYRKNPENHPLYDQEWNSFWKRRKEDLVAQGIDHRSYNYQPEWVHFFRQRLEQLFGEELHKSTIIVRKHLNIPLDAEEDSHPAPPRVRSPPRSRKTYVKQFQNDKSLPVGSEVETKRYRFDSGNSALPIAANADNKPNIIHVLRIMTALEDHLGSLGSKVMELLSKALVLEKHCLGNPIELERKVLTADNCTLLETAMEKLKGILYAGLLDGHKIEGFNRVIQYTANMLKHADTMGYRRNPTVYSDKSDRTKDLQKLIEVMQNKRSDVSSSNQKSLSDTLMDLISFQRRDIPDEAGRIRHSDSHSKNFAFSNAMASANESEQDAFTFNRSSFVGSNSDEMFKQNNRYSNTQRLDGGNGMSAANHMGLSNFNTNLNRNARPLAYSDKSFASGGNNLSNVGSGGGAGARNNYNNTNFNKKANGNSINNMNTPNVGGFGNNNLSNFGPQANSGHMPNMSHPGNVYRNNLGTGAADGNWSRMQNTNTQQQQWSSNRQPSQQYQNQYGGSHF